MSIRALVIIGRAFAVGGLRGVVAEDMHLCNVGFVGHAGAFPIASLLMASLFFPAPPRERSHASAF